MMTPAAFVTCTYLGRTMGVCWMEIESIHTPAFVHRMAGMSATDGKAGKGRLDREADRGTGKGKGH